MNMVEISAKRYTTKYYDKSKKIPTEQLQQLCKILQNSPSSVNAQPWHFIVVGSEAGKTNILPAVAEFNHPRITDSSHTVIFCAKVPLDEAHLQNLLAQEQKDGRYPNEQAKLDQDAGRHFFVNKNSTTANEQLNWESKQIYIALGHLLLAAAAMDIDSTSVEGFDDVKMDEILGLKEKGLKSVVIATLGYHDPKDSNALRPKSRLPQEQIFTFL